jgi:DNA-binding ferritin-like protein (Dps family)
MKSILSYNENTNTIRQLPENYLIAYKENNRWICEPYLAANKELSMRVFNALFDFNTKYGDGITLLSKVTPNSEF